MHVCANIPHVQSMHMYSECSVHLFQMHAEMILFMMKDGSAKSNDI